jgi:hypothetical protein
MANTTGIALTDNTYNYLGPLYVIGENRTPALSMIGGMRGYKPAPGFEYAMEQYAALESAAQRTTTEALAAAGTGTQRTYVKAQRTNAAQIMYYPVEVSYAKASERLKLAGLSFSTPQEVMESELDFQYRMTLLQMALDLEYTILQGTYLTKSGSTVNSTTRGLIEAAEGGTSSGGLNKTDASAAALSKALMDGIAKKLADSGAPLTRPVIFCGSFQAQAISDLYGWTPMGGAGAGLGGVRVNRIMTQFFEAEVVFDAQMPADTILIADMDKIQLRGVEIAGKGGAIVFEELGKTGAAWKYQLYAQLGLDYSDPNFHASLYNLSTT